MYYYIVKSIGSETAILSDCQGIQAVLLNCNDLFSDSFTVELCESVQVQAIDIGNLELFSSLPQSFDVHVSDR